MSARDDEAADQSDNGPDKSSESQTGHGKDDGGSPNSTSDDDSGVPEPNEEHKEQAAEMMTAYEDRPTLVLPGSAKTISGTAVNDWIDDDGNPKYMNDDDTPAAEANTDKGTEDKNEKADDSGDKDEADSDDEVENKYKFSEEQLESDKKFNEEIIKATKEDPDRASAN
ncbi:hypothetical protein [Mycobacterium kubicae]|uniref:hypothetical protein n=1 Tax=Mycobacterium kubicae TaxID=120959 RepID=UPI000A7B5F6C|nr:hypothetical protein [Mycobacterium kubicae]